MKIQKLKGLAFDKVSGVVGVISEVNHIEETIEVVLSNGTNEVIDIENAVFLEEIGELNGQMVYNQDVLVFKDDVAEELDEDNEKLWEVELLDNGKVVLHLLEIVGKEFKRKQSGEEFNKSLLKEFESILEVLANINELEIEIEEKVVDFNIAIVKRNTSTHIEYLYACNNKEKEEIDLIKVVFVGARLLEEEEYSRETITHEEYLELLEDGMIKEVSPQELQNYATGVMHGKTQESHFVEEQDLEDEDEDEDSDFDSNCPDCGENYFNCECE